MSTLMLPRGSNPSNSVTICNIVRWTSLSLPPSPSPEVLLPPMASTSSKNIMHAFFGPRHREELPDHPRAFADVLLYELRTDNSDKTSVRPVGHRSGRQRLARARRAVQQYSLRGVNPQRQKPLRMQQGQFYHFPELLQRVLR